VVSPDDLNAVLPRVIIAPITSKGQSLDCRPTVEFDGRAARILLDQIRAVDKRRLISKMGSIDKRQWHYILMEMLA
jgi:mRNA interferase MazF